MDSKFQFRCVRALGLEFLPHLEETCRVAQNHVIRLRGVLGALAVAQGWAAREELEQMAQALIAWGESSDAFYARPGFTAIGRA